MLFLVDTRDCTINTIPIRNLVRRDQGDRIKQLKSSRFTQKERIEK
jgi:hypothetical protein